MHPDHVLTHDELDAHDRELMAADRQPPVQAAAQSCAEALDKLTSTVAQLEDRLDPVRNRRTKPDPDPGDPPAAKASLVATHLREYTATVNRLGHRLAIVLEELEV